MFPSSPLDKSCVGSDNCSSGRNNASCRFPVGITPLGDENQHIRIQLAVNKYNSSANNSQNNRCAVISPARHSFLKNTLKVKDYDGEAERTSKNEKKNGYEYEGVGAFPTIHLKKSTVRYRPIRRFNDVKIPYPELPVNRFLSHLPEVCPDLKTSTRSVLDVLEDLSGKKIHVKEDNRNNKSKTKGLGGDYFSNPNAVYKPLFIQKPKMSSILTRDNTTQTLSPLGTEMPSLQSNNSFTRNDASDARAELRRKLAKQNNEIFASLSSSISSSFALKRKRDKALPSKEENFTDRSTAKKSKTSDDQPKNFNENGVSKIVGWPKTNSINSTKLNRKSKLKDTNSPSSPNKDRLMTIFLDMQSTNSKARMFNNNLLSTDTGSIENHLEASTINGVKNRVENSDFKSSSDIKTVKNGEDESALKNSPSLSFTEKTTSQDPKKLETGQPSKSIFNSKPGTTQNDLLKSPPSSFQFDIITSNTSNFSFSKTSDPLKIRNESNLGGTSQNSAIDGPDKETKNNNDQVLGKTFISGSSIDKSNFSSFKFGAEGNISPGLGMFPKDLKTPTSKANSISASTASSSTLQFAFAPTTNVLTFKSQTSAVKVDVTNAHETLTTPAKASFSFGKSASPSPQGSESKIEDKNKMSNGMPPSIVVTTQSIQPNAFSFDQKSSTDSSSNTVVEQNVPNLTLIPTGQPNNVSFSPSDTGLNSNTKTTMPNNKALFILSQKTENPVTSTATVPAIQEQKFSFSFGKKSDTDKNKAQEGFDRKSSNLFSFGQKSTSQESTQSIPVSTPQSQPASLIGQILPAPSTPTMTFGQTSASQITDGFGAKSGAISLGNTAAPAFSQSNSAFPIKTSLFGSTSGFGNATTQASFGFGTSTSSSSGFRFGASTTTQPTQTFGITSASQTGPVFRTSSTTQSISGFGNSGSTQSTSAFGTETPNSTPTFGVSVTTQPASTFGVSSATQSAPSFGTTSTTQSASTFGTSSSTPSFGVPSTSHSTFGASSTQSTPTFGTSGGFGVSSPSQPNAMFGTPASSPSAVSFGTATTQSNSSFGAPPCFSTASSTLPNTTFGASVATSTSEFGTAQLFGSKPTSSLNQTANIFGQNLAPNFSSNTTFNSNQNNVFGQTPSTEGGVFDQNKTQTPAFGTSTQAFNTQNKLSFGMSTSNLTGFNTPPPNTTTAPVFSFGGSTTENTFAFGSNTSGSNNPQSPFGFKNPGSEPFKFGVTTTKEGSGFGGTNTATFTFGGGQMNNNAMAEPKSTFNFGNTQVSSSAPFNFGTTPSPSVFSFGSSASSAGSGSSFSFGTPNPTPGGPFGQTSTPSPAAPFAVPGTFCIGSGSSQSRPRATSRPRRRP